MVVTMNCSARSGFELAENFVPWFGNGDVNRNVLMPYLIVLPFAEAQSGGGGKCSGIPQLRIHARSGGSSDRKLPAMLGGRQSPAQGRHHATFGEQENRKGDLCNASGGTRRMSETRN